jgi:glutamate racemase
MIDADIDYLVLGCSHYPYLIPQIKEILPNHIQIIDSGEAVVNKPRVFYKKSRDYNRKK